MYYMSFNIGSQLSHRSSLIHECKYSCSVDLVMVIFEKRAQHLPDTVRDFHNYGWIWYLHRTVNFNKSVCKFGEIAK